MPTDLTGTPTSLGIGTFNTSNDAPSGLGFNEAMAQIDALVAARVAAPSGIAAGEVPVWNGSTWVRSSTTRINNAGSTLPKVTTSTFAGGPPGTPTDGDIWIATQVEATRNLRWMFQYDSSETTYKWKFIGGPDQIATQSAALSTPVVNTWQQSDCVLPIVRPGDYNLRLTGHFSQDTTQNANVFIGVHYSGTPTADIFTDLFIMRTAGDEYTEHLDFGVNTFPTTGNLTAEGQSNVKSAANYPHYTNMRIAVTPVRIS